MVVGQGGGLPPIKCREFPTYFSRVSDTASQVTFCLGGVDAVTWRRANANEDAWVPSSTLLYVDL